jgi:SAM-dependent methyltransferase
MTHSNFDSHWLSLREPVDHRSRATNLSLLLADYWKDHEDIKILDLGCGTGSNMRYLSPYLENKNQQWTLLDHDSSLLQQISRPQHNGLKLEPLLGDLNKEGLALVAKNDLVTGSALLDLTSEEWLTKLAERCISQSCVAYFTLSYNGDVSWHSTQDGDTNPAYVRDHDRICNIFNRHQTRDKGTGPALGPSAVGKLNDLFEDNGYATKCSPSPWLLDHRDRSLNKLLIEGWAESALEECPNESKRILSWSRTSLEMGNSLEYQLQVSHLDFLAFPQY